ncbi:uncharacterized protein LOC135476609 [Liolophura sinensis]|uniref:uncharacterized protein LOC135476609 n=1 Tax=Liolophura sinensis TaxID=3198878 RepID=UPI003158E0C7
MEFNDQENQPPVLKESVAPPRQPLHDVINCTQSNLPLPSSRCKIPVPHKSVKPSGLKPPSSHSTGLVSKRSSHITHQRDERSKLSSRNCNCADKLKQDGKVVIDHEEYETLKHDAYVTKRGLLLMEKLNETTAEELVESKSKSEGLEAELRVNKDELQLVENRLQVETERLESLVASQESMIQKQKSALAYKTSQLEQQKNTIMTLDFKLVQLEGMKDAKEFLEAEHSALADEQASLRQANEATQLRLRTCEEELSSCRERLAESEAQRATLDVRVRELSYQLTEKTAEIEALQTVGRGVLEDQAQKIHECGQTVNKLTHKLTGLLRTLLSTTGMKVSETVVKDFGKKSDYPWMHSLVSSVLDAVDHNMENSLSSVKKVCDSGDSETQTETSSDADQNDESGSDNPQVYQAKSQVSWSLETENVHSPVTSSRMSLGSSFTSSAFQPVRGLKDSRQSSVISESGDTDSSILPASPQSLTSKARARLGIPELADTEKQPDLTEESDHLSALVSEIGRINYVLEQAALLSLDDLRKENDYLREELETVDRKSKMKDKELEGLRDEVKRVKCQLRELTTEKDALLRQQEELVARLESCATPVTSVTSQASAETRLCKEKLHLQKTVYILQEKLNQKSEELDQLNEKASRRMTVLAENWGKADEEVKELDKMLENVRLVLHKNKPVFKNSTSLNKLLKDLDGVADDSVKSLVKPLEAVKTSSW